MARESAHKRGYTKRWQKESKQYLRTNEHCVHCKARGETTLATEVDHITPHKGDKRLFWNRQNWQSLCKSCHSVKTQHEQYGTRPKGSDEQGNPADPDHPWNTG